MLDGAIRFSSEVIINDRWNTELVDTLGGIKPISLSALRYVSPEFNIISKNNFNVNYNYWKGVHE
jgi:hypothetical protein